MLAQLLRRMLLAQLLIGAGVGYALSPAAQPFSWLVLAWAVLLPVLTTVLAILITGLKSREATEPWGMWLSALVGETVASIQVFMLRQPWSVAAPGFLPATQTASQVPVVLVHGYVCNHRIWDDTIAALRANGHPVIAVNLEPLFPSIDQYAVIVETAVTELCAQTGASKVALVGHSMGGLVIRAWMRAHGSERVARVLTLGTPHAGTQIAPRTSTRNGREMCWQSQWLAELAPQESDANRGLIRIAITAQDNIVYPQRAQVLPGVAVTVFEGMGHLQMCLEKTVIDWVLEQLAPLVVDAVDPALPLR